MPSPRLFRVIMPAADIDASAQFYAALLDSPGMRVSGGRHYFDCGGVILAVYSPAGDRDAKVPRPNFDHVYFAVDDLDAVFGRAEKAGGLVAQTGDGGQPMGEIARRPWGELSFYMRDPFGNPICFVDSATLFTKRE